jgi:hypothetical protein
MSDFLAATKARQNVLHFMPTAVEKNKHEQNCPVLLSSSESFLAFVSAISNRDPLMQIDEEALSHLESLRWIASMLVDSQHFSRDSSARTCFSFCRDWNRTKAVIARLLPPGATKHRENHVAGFAESIVVDVLNKILDLRKRKPREQCTEWDFIRGEQFILCCNQSSP